MRNVNATDLKSHFGEFLDLAREEPIGIRKSGKSVAVMLSGEEFEYYQALEDAYLGIQAEQAIERGDFVSHADAMRIINDRLARGE